MDLLSNVAKTSGQKELDLGVDVLYIIFQNEFSGIDLSKDLVQSFCQGLELFCGQQTY